MKSTWLFIYSDLGFRVERSCDLSKTVSRELKSLSVLVLLNFANFHWQSSEPAMRQYLWHVAICLLCETSPVFLRWKTLPRFEIFAKGKNLFLHIGTFQSSDKRQTIYCVALQWTFREPHQSNCCKFKVRIGSRTPDVKIWELMNLR